MGSLDVPFLGRLVAAGEHDYQQIAAAGEIEPVTGSNVDSQLGYRAANGSPVTEVPCFRQAEPGSDANLGSLVGQIIQPGLKFLGLENCIHCGSVSERIRKSSSADWAISGSNA